MAFTFSSVMIYLLFSVYLLQCSQTNSRNIVSDNHLRLKLHDHDHYHHHTSMSHHIDPNDPELNLFFHYNNLQPGNKILIYFPTKDPSTSPHLLPKEDSASIPFSTSQFKKILKFFSFPEESKQAMAMKSTLQHCEFPPIKGETKFCATSLESMLDSVREIFGLNSKSKVISTRYLSGPITPLQNYTVIDVSEKIVATKMMGCHMLPYPYAVYYCHGQDSDNKLYKILLEGEADGHRVEPVGICHMDTSQWDPNHISFRVLKTVPGASPVCHFFPVDNLVWLRKHIHSQNSTRINS